jgi:hypothetical protein
MRMPRWLAPVAVLGCIGGALGYTMWSNPAASGADSIPTCLLKLTTGLDCPGCGGTRAAWFLLHGDVPAAARHHMLFVFAVPFLLYLYVAWAGKTVFGWNLPQLTLTPKLLGMFLGAWGLSQHDIETIVVHEHAAGRIGEPDGVAAVLTIKRHKLPLLSHAECFA